MQVSYLRIGRTAFRLRRSSAHAVHLPRPLLLRLFLKGFTGLSITIGAIITLFIVMQLTVRIDWRRPTQEQATA
jgi:membrane protein CcdC involved in cytochrome C biogenesis